MNSIPTDRMRSLWTSIFGNSGLEKLDSFIREMQHEKENSVIVPLKDEWYKDVIIYSLYVDLFNNDLKGLEEQLDYLEDLGVSCLWLLPILDSPMRDAGFDISDYRRIRPDLLGLPATSTSAEQDEVFMSFMEKAHSKGIHVIFDIAINHTSDEHPWFIESRKSKDNPFRDYYIWNSDDKKYKDARIIFYGIEESNWKKDGDEYYLHRFFDFQPDLNYRNPDVLIEMSRNMIFWLKRGADGFRADAIPYLWKEEGTACENEPATHLLVKFFRAILDFMRPNTMLLAEACQKPKKVIKYFGEGNECNAGYHFPLMPQMFKALAAEDAGPIIDTLSLEVTPPIPEGTQWLTFLRCHDELSLELVYVTEEDRKYIHDNYCTHPEWDFRKGQGISARLSELMGRNPGKMALIYSIMLTLPGTPVIYYGDEFGKFNDEEYYREQIKLTGKDDTRFLVRGKIDWNSLEDQLQDQNSFSSRIYSELRSQITVRKNYKAFGRGDIEWLKVTDCEGQEMKEVAAYVRTFENERILIIQNLSDKSLKMNWPVEGVRPEMDLFGKKILAEGKAIILQEFGYHWLSLA